LTLTIIERRVLELLRDYFDEDIDSIILELENEYDAEIDSIYFVELIPFIESEYNIAINPDEIHNDAKRSFKSFCMLVEHLIH